MLEQTDSMIDSVDRALIAVADWIKKTDKSKDCPKGLGKLSYLMDWLDNIEQIVREEGNIPVKVKDKGDITRWNIIEDQDFPVKGCSTIFSYTDKEPEIADPVVMVSPLRDSPEVSKHVRIVSHAHGLLRVCECLYTGRATMEDLKRVIDEAYGTKVPLNQKPLKTQVFKAEVVGCIGD